MEWKDELIWRYCDKIKSVPPAERWGHTDAIVGTDIWIFGGYHGTRLNDIWVLDISTPDFEWKQPFLSGPTPVGRSYHTASVIGQKVYIFGGNDGAKRLNDLWIIDTKRMQWQKIYANGPIPKERSGHTCSVIGDNLWIFGGVTGGGKIHLNDVWILDTVAMEWRIVTPSGPKPRERSGHSAATIGDKIYIFGGYDGEGRLDDIWILDTTNIKWKQPGIKGHPPKERKSHTATSIGENILVFGGYGGSDRLNDLWNFNTIKMEWEQIKVNNKLPGGRSAHSASLVDSRLIVFGGYNGARLNDVWVLYTGEHHEYLNQAVLVPKSLKMKGTIQTLKRKLIYSEKKISQLKQQNKKLMRENDKLRQSPFVGRPQHNTDKEREVEDWLTSIRLEQYCSKFIDDGFDDLEVIKEISESDLNTIGIEKAGHKKKLY